MVVSMSTAAPPPPLSRDIRARLARAEAQAGRRLRWERVWARYPVVLWGLAIGLFLLAGLAFFLPIMLPFLGLGAGAMALLALLLLGWEYGRSIEPKLLRSQMDHHAILPDVVLTAGDWSGTKESDASPWQVNQLQQAAEQIETIQWKKAWPVHPPQHWWMPLAVVVMLGIILSRMEAPAVSVSEVAGPKGLNTSQKDLAEEIADTFDDWQVAQEQTQDPDLAELLDAVKPLREKLAEGELGERELYLELNNVQQRLEQMQAQMEQKSLEAMAEEMAQAMDQLDQGGALAAALRRKDFDAAQRQAEQLAEKLRKGEAKPPEGQRAQQASQQMQQLAQKMQQRGQQGAAQAMQQLGQGTQQRDGQQMSRGMQQMAQQFSREQQRQGQGQGLSHQINQMQAAKQQLSQRGQQQQGQQGGQGQQRDGGSRQQGQQGGQGQQQQQGQGQQGGQQQQQGQGQQGQQPGQGQGQNQQGQGPGQSPGNQGSQGGGQQGSGSGMSLGMPKLTEVLKQQQQGRGAGSDIAANKFGEATGLDVTRTQEFVSGQMTESGMSEITTEKTLQPQLEKTSDGTAEADFSVYEELSRQAIEDENLPHSHRQSIRRYFESIRPTDNQGN